MPTCVANITAIDTTNYTGTYSDGGGPGQVATNGDIDFNKGTIPSGTVSIEWNLPTGYTFATSNPVTIKKPDGTDPAPGEFTLPASGGGTSVTIGDVDDRELAYEYTLNLSNGHALDPKIINRGASN